MLAGVVIVPVVSLLTPKLSVAHLDRVFGPEEAPEETAAAAETA